VLTLVGGYQGIGKSTITLNLAATVSKGGKWPVSGESASKGNVIIVSCEDNSESVISPRLVAAGADQDNTIILEEAGFRLDKDIPRLKRLIESMGNVQLVIIDPVGAHLGKADNNSLGDVRGITSQLAELAKECDLAIVCVLHLNKNSKVMNALDRFSGSGAWTQAARNAFLVDANEFEPSRLQMSTAKTNLPGAQQVTYFCKINQATLPADPKPIKTSVIEWENYTENKGANQVLIEKGGKLGEHMAEIQDMLERGPIQREDFDKRTSHMSFATKKRAKELLGVKYVQEGKDKGYYHIPRVAQAA
jgi:putative DNA primase/helicase